LNPPQIEKFELAVRPLQSRASEKKEKMTHQIKAIPEGMHTITPHLVVKGASQAIEFYKKAFGAQEVLRLNSPQSKSIIHAQLKIGNSYLFLADEVPEMGARGPERGSTGPVTIHLYLEDVDSTFNAALAAGAQSLMPPADMFWGDRYGRLADPFGHQWSLGTHKEDLTAEEMSKRAQTAFCSGAE
jgi:PhnB protein